MHPSPLPVALGSAFSVGAARRAGVMPSRLRAGDLSQPYHGVRAVRGSGGDGPTTVETALLERALHYAHRMTEHEFFSHVTAAVLWGLPLPYPLVADRVPDVAVLFPRRAPAGRGVLGHALKKGMTRSVRHPQFGVRVASVATTWALLGGLLPRLEDVVAVADAAVRQPLHPDDAPALATIDQLHAAVRAGRRVGNPLLREALPCVSTRSRSRAESRMRVLLSLTGLPDAEVNFDVIHRGEWLAQVDLAYPAAKLALEYEGEHHLTDPAQWAVDIARVERLAEAGWRVIRVTKADLDAGATGLAERVRRVLARA